MLLGPAPFQCTQVFCCILLPLVSLYIEKGAVGHFVFIFVFNFKNKVQFFSPMGGLHIFIIPHSCHYFCQLNHILESMITVMDRDISRATRGDSARERCTTSTALNHCVTLRHIRGGFGHIGRICQGHM